MSNNNAGHLYGESVIKGDYFAVETTSGNKPIEYTTTNGLKLKEVAEPVSESDAATKQYVDDNAGGDVVKIVYDDTTMSVEDLGAAVKAVSDAGKIPAIVWDGGIYYSQSAITQEGGFLGVFAYWDCGIQDGALILLAVAALSLVYTENDGWTLQDAYKEINVGGN